MCPFCILSHRSKFINNNTYIFMSLNIVFVLANSEDPDEMQHNDVFQSICLPVSKMKGLKLAKLP